MADDDNDRQLRLAAVLHARARAGDGEPGFDAANGATSRAGARPSASG